VSLSKAKRPDEYSETGIKKGRGMAKASLDLMNVMRDVIEPLQLSTMRSGERREHQHQLHQRFRLPPVAIRTGP